MLLARVNGDLITPTIGQEGSCCCCGSDVFAMESRSGSTFWAHSKRINCAHVSPGQLTWREGWESIAPTEARGCVVHGIQAALLSPGGLAIRLASCSREPTAETDPWPLVGEPLLVGKRALILDWRDAADFVIQDRDYLTRFGGLASVAPKPVFDLRDGWDSKTRIAPHGTLRLPDEPLVATAPLPTLIDFGSRANIVLRIDGTGIDTATAFAINRRWIAEHVALVMHGATEPHACLAARDWDGVMPENYSPHYGGQVFRKPEPQPRLPV